MEFTEALNKTTSNISYTENGMQGYKTTSNPYLDFLYKISSFRGKSEEELNKIAFDFINSLGESAFRKYLLKFILYIRDPRNGLGERALGRELLAVLFKYFDFENKEDIFTWIVNRLYDYGRWDDYVSLVQDFYLTEYGSQKNKEGVPHIWQLITSLKKTLEDDLKNIEIDANPTLLAKWMPSINASSDTTRSWAKFFAMNFGWSEKQYRQTLSKLRKYLKVTERQMSLQEWNEIDYEKVPSLANLRYNDAFLRHDEERRVDYLSKLANGKAKINSSVNFPHDIVHKYKKLGSRWGPLMLDYDETLEQLWKNLKQIDGLKDTLVVRDDSGSMTAFVGNSNLTALEIATALGIYCSEHCSKEYQNKIISFSMNPKYLDFSDKNTLHDKLEYLYKHNEIANTNIRKVFQLILKTAIDNKLKQEDLPKQILIISDMEFDEGVDYRNNPIEEAQKEFEKYRYKVPKLVFWNVNGRTNTIPVNQNELGVYLLSGFSPNILNMLENGDLDPMKALINELNKSCFEEVPEII